MPHRLVVLGGQIPLALVGDDVQEFRSRNAAQRAQRSHQLGQAVAVDRAEISEIETLEKIAVVEHPLLHGVARLLTQPQQPRRRRQNAPHPPFHTVVVHRSRHLEQAVLQRAGHLVDSHVVVVENHQQIGVAARTGVVEPLESQTARHRTVADDGHHLVFFAPQFGRLGHAERRRDRDRGVAAAESVVFALGHAREAADAPQFAFVAKGFAAPGDDLVGIGLMAHVPHDLVFGRIVNIVDSRRQFHGAETRRQVAGVDRALLDDVAAQFVAIGAQFLLRELFELARRIDQREYLVDFGCHCGTKIRISRVQCQIYLSIAEAKVSKTESKIRLSEGKSKLACILPSGSILGEAKDCAR